MSARPCSRCQTPIVVPHCASPNCTWCKGCYDRKLEETKR